jgi:ferredoxin--NADP+ reductase
MTEHDNRTLRVAVIGAGPAGIYLADALCNQSTGPVAVDIYDRLPTPFGLLRYGVAPDHLKVKALAAPMQRTLDDERVRFLGNVTVGVDVLVPELLSDYHAVAYSFGAAANRSLNVPQSNLAGVIPAARFVSWYSGHPDSAIDELLLTVDSIAVIGLGNVALDVSRILLRDPAELAATDVPDHVLQQLHRSRVRCVIIIGRRGPEDAKFTTKELRELGDLRGVDIVIDRRTVERVDVESIDRPDARRNLALFAEWANRTPRQSLRQLVFQFGSEPLRFVGTDRVRGIEIRTSDGHAEMVEIGAAMWAVGYRGVAIPSVPFDESAGIVPTVDHRVVGGSVPLGEYACGWIKRGPTGVLGTNRSDSLETAQVILGDRKDLQRREVAVGSALSAMLQRGARPVDLDGWAAIDHAEMTAGSRPNCPRIKLSTWQELLGAGLGEGLGRR